MKSPIILAAVMAAVMGGASMASDEKQLYDEPKGTQPSHPPPAHKEPTAPAPQTETGNRGAPAPQDGQAAAATPQLEFVRMEALGVSDVKDLQYALASLGYYKGRIDGIAGPQTRRAFINFFGDQAKLMVRGRIGEVSLVSLGWTPSDIERVRGVDETGEPPPENASEKAPEKVPETTK